VLAVAYRDHRRHGGIEATWGAHLNRKTNPAGMRKTPRSWAFWVAPPIGIEPMTYALREARNTAPETTTCTDRLTCAPECSRRTACSRFRATTRATACQPSDNRVLLDRPEWH
jgi:hypothetical protein